MTRTLSLMLLAAGVLFGLYDLERDWATQVPLQIAAGSPPDAFLGAARFVTFDATARASKMAQFPKLRRVARDLVPIEDSKGTSAIFIEQYKLEDMGAHGLDEMPRTFSGWITPRSESDGRPFGAPFKFDPGGPPRPAVSLYILFIYGAVLLLVLREERRRRGQDNVAQGKIGSWTMNEEAKPHPWTGSSLFVFAAVFECIGLSTRWAHRENPATIIMPVASLFALFIFVATAFRGVLYKEGFRIEREVPKARWTVDWAELRWLKVTRGNRGSKGGAPVSKIVFETTDGRTETIRGQGYPFRDLLASIDVGARKHGIPDRIQAAASGSKHHP